MHSAKKWERLHADYEGADGELLWNIYYGEYAEDERFDAFRRHQMWNADVIRPMIEMDLEEPLAEGLSAPLTVETTDSCESYDEKYSELDLNSSYAQFNDPCWGYSTSCCESTETTNGCCYWKDTTRCIGTYSTCDEDDGEDCPACCASVGDDEAECTPTMAPTTESPVVEATV